MPLLILSGLRTTNENWMAVCRIQTRRVVVSNDADFEDTSMRMGDHEPFQHVEHNLVDVHLTDAVEGPGDLNDPSGQVVEI